ncbi:MAG: cytochrome c oxidase subunit 2 [Pseudonocardiales bacterium]|nr:cytochrome c oxidase subunit 2 [Pseudonocardiales bacterium]
MRRRRWTRGGRLALLVGSLALVLSGCSAHDVERNLRFGWPTGVTKQAEKMRVLWTWSGVAALIVGIGVWGLIFWCCIRYRKKSDELPRQTKYNLPLEIVYSIIPFVIIAGLFYRTIVVEDNVNKLTKNPDVRVQVDAFKWNWQFEYHQYMDASGAMQQAVYPGQKDLAAASGNTKDKRQGAAGQIGCDEASSNQSFSCGASGTQINTANSPLFASTVGSDNEIPVLVLPVGETVRVLEHSEDVIHSFWVPEFLFKRDVIPYGTASTSRDNQFEFTPTSTGSFVGRCAELCGTYHSQMNFEVRIVTADTFQKYIQALIQIGPNDPARQSKALTAAGLSPFATTTHPFNTDRSAGAPSTKAPGAS